MARPGFDPRRADDNVPADYQTAIPLAETEPDLGRTIPFIRYAELVANGELPFPVDGSAAEESRLVQEVGRLRRFRLLKYIARAIALDIHRAGRP